MARGRFWDIVVAAACMALMVLVFSALAPRAYASEAVAADDEIITVAARAHSVDPDGWSATVSYKKPQAGAPTEFTITADGGSKGSGSYQYQQGFIYKYDPYVWIYDPTFGSGEPYRDSNVLCYQFVGAGRYQYQFVVRDTEAARYMRFSFDVVIEGDGFIDADEKAEEIVSLCLPEGNRSDYETALVLHDWIIDNVSYDYTYRNLSVDRALSGMAVTCEGYHAAYVKLLETAGMETGRIEGGGHVWTAVKMDGEWYHVDTTHDDVKDSLTGADVPGFLTREQQAHLLFGLDDKTMALANPGYQGPTAGYEANSLEANYFVRTGDILEWSDPVATQILEKLNAREDSFVLTAPTANWAQKSYRDVISNLVAYELNQAEWTTDNQRSDAVVHVDYADGSLLVDAFAVLAAAPTVSRDLIYNGSNQEGLAIPSVGSYVLSGTTKATDAGTYTAVVAPGAGFAWDKSGDRTARNYQWTIKPASIASESVTVSGVGSSYEYTGSPVRPSVTVTHNGRVLKLGTDYQVSYGENIGIGEATVVIRGVGKNYSGSRTISFDIAAPRNVWMTADGKTCYYGDHGQLAKGNQKIGGYWYYFSDSGVMQEGWITWADGRKSYFAPGTGRAKLGWQRISGKWYYFDPGTGRSLRYEQRINGNLFYFNSRCEMVEGWVTWMADGRKSYFAPGTGRAKLGWQRISGKWYYFDPLTGRTR